MVFSFLYVYMQYFPVPPWFMILGHYSWASTHGIYLAKGTWIKIIKSLKNCQYKIENAISKVCIMNHLCNASTLKRVSKCFYQSKTFLETKSIKVICKKIEILSNWNLCPTIWFFIFSNFPENVCCCSKLWDNRVLRKIRIYSWNRKKIEPKILHR